MAHDDTIIVEWTTPEFTYRKKHVDWYWGLGIIVVVVVVISIVTKNFLLGVLVLLAGGLLFFFSKKQPSMTALQMSDQGIKINESLYPYDNIESFWIGANMYGEPILFLHIKRPISPLVIVPIHPELDRQDLRNVLLEYLPEVEHAEPFGHRLSDRIGF
jgi:hypothetical protein